MKTSLKTIFVALIAVVALVAVGWADEVVGKVTDTGFGSFMLDDAGTLRQFNLSSRNTAYEPTAWRPTSGDEIQIGRAHV